MRLIGAVTAMVLGTLALGGCNAAPRGAWSGGDPKAGATVIAQEACGSCHMIPGIAQADGMVGPPLKGFARRQVIAGMLANTPANLIRYLKAPQEVVKGNVMPDQNLTDRQARDIAAYLYKLD